MVGLVFYARTPRAISPDAAGKLARRARGRAAIVALTVDADDNLFDRLMEQITPDYFQLHGHETPERAAALRARLRRPIMKALSVSDAQDLHAMPAYAPAVDRFLFDTRPPQGKVRPGGRGTVFDWSLIEGIERMRPIMLSGGLNCDNVAAAIRSVRPDAVDVSSGVESAPGVKDPARIHAFIRAARAAAAPALAPRA
jgi:phosphoribosylanthranilate isomerase